MLSCYSLPVRVEEYKKLCICEQRAAGGGGGGGGGSGGGGGQH